MRQHPVHDAVAALTRTQRMRVEVTPRVSYRVEAPCLLAQLADAVALGTERGGRGVPGSRANVALDALDLWREVVTNVHGWAAHLELDRGPYLPRRHGGRGPDRPAQQRQPAPWWTMLDPAAADVVHQVPPVSSERPPAPRRELVTPPRPEVPPVGRLLRLVAASATGRGLDPIADAIHRNAVRWHAQIEQMLHGVHEQRGVRGATCPSCEASTVLEDREDGRYPMPAIVLVARDVAGEQLHWLACLACGWSRGAGELLDATIANYLVTIADVYAQLYRLLRPCSQNLNRVHQGRSACA